VVVLRDGAIEQVGSPLALYDRPANQFVAQFIGTPQMNLVDTAALPAMRGLVGAASAPDGFIGVRPENVLLRNAGSGAISGKVELVESLGADTLIYAAVGDGAKAGVQIVSRQNTRTTLRVGDAVGMDIAPNSFHLFNREGQVVARAA
jgi:multiple sugar transport system ATP-binding protein